MSVGDAIFWSTILVLAALGGRTISKAGKWKAVRTVLLATIGALILIAAVMWSWSRYNERPIVADELSGIQLGMKPVDVKLLKGTPFNDGTATPTVKDGEASMVWGFRDKYSDRILAVHFAGPTVDSVGVVIVCERNGYSKLFGLGTSSSEADVIKKLGQPTNTSIDSAGLAKLISYRPWNAAFGVSKGLVNELCVASSGTVVFTNEYR